MLSPGYRISQWVIHNAPPNKSLMSSDMNSNSNMQRVTLEGCKVRKALMGQVVQQHPFWQSELCEFPSSSSLQHPCADPQSPSGVLSGPRPHQRLHCPANAMNHQQARTSLGQLKRNPARLLNKHLRLPKLGCCSLYCCALPMPFKCISVSRHIADSSQAYACCSLELSGPD